MQRVEEYEDKKSWLFLNFNPPLISKFDLMWIFSSDLYRIGVMIANITYQMIELEIMFNLKVVAL